ncbi:hypothetical protein [Bradyrhizobium mercantei]|uniref:hypothetical protein n=1 Tax=Bradyrhizobium mercantei TaxID=1904807 RepID=UPI00142E8FA9|nr:hypothetical protein [Bradyrhizobium mercantei]
MRWTCCRERLGVRAATTFPSSPMSVCIIAAQIVMAAVAVPVGRKADLWGRSSRPRSRCQQSAVRLTAR